ncbi:restriction endonuclease subunit S [Bacillus arachidis]|uniref:restriction endonuclease subunit S n=1 Tax=Bacillus arachidis TaxID=2819290 RepID=UPI00255C7C6E|nr:restriction endonuclease subunit S [Bacillus arachidis]WIY58986.1 restriction endonuclease subunit S [Bacillus arachidis]
MREGWIAVREGWRSVSLGDHVDLLTGFPFKSKIYTDNPEDIKLLRGDNIAQQYLRWDRAKYLSREDEAQYEKFRLLVGDVVLAMDRPWIEAGLKISRIQDKDLPSLLVQRVSRLRGTETLDERFLYYVLTSKKFTEYVLSVQTGTGVPHISAGQIKSYRFLMPPFSIQRKIGEILGSFDDKIELNLRMNETLEQIAMTLYKHWFVDFGPFQDGEFEESELGDIPKGWTVVDINYFGQVITGKTPSTKNKNYYNGEIPFIKIPDMHGQTYVLNTESTLSEMGAESQKTKYLPENSICVSCIATVGLVSLVYRTSQTNQQINSVIPLRDYYTFYLYLVLKEKKEDLLTLGSSGTTTLNVNKTTFSKMNVILPTEKELKDFHIKMKGIFDLILANQEQIQELQNVRDFLLPRLLSGEIPI